MMITLAEVARIASLARLRLDAAETRAMAEQLGSILEHVDALGGVDVTGVDPVPAIIERGAPLRPDELGPDALVRPVSDLAPRWEAPFLVVPRIAALDADASAAAEEA